MDGRNLPGTRQRCRTRLRRNAGMERFWDPEAVSAVFSSGIKITMVALESTHNVPLTPAVRMSWAKDRRYPGIDFIGNSYAFVPELSMFETNSTYFLWDVLTTCALEDPTLIKQRPLNAASIPTSRVTDARILMTTAEKLSLSTMSTTNASLT